MHQKQNPAGFYTKGEEIFNAVSHGAGSVLAIGGTGALVALAAALANWRTVLICLVYGLSLVVLYTMSTLYHAFPFEGVKRLFRVFTTHPFTCSLRAVIRRSRLSFWTAPGRARSSAA